jgi:hypothetical protein
MVKNCLVDIVQGWEIDQKNSNRLLRRVEVGSPRIFEPA